MKTFMQEFGTAVLNGLLVLMWIAGASPVWAQQDVSTIPSCYVTEVSSSGTVTTASGPEYCGLISSVALPPQPDDDPAPVDCVANPTADGCPVP